jgi:uncharacterized membrane protein YphA (DoxX/SURF4 family)
VSGTLELLASYEPFLLLLLRVVIGLNIFVGRGIRHILTERRQAAEKWKSRGVPPIATNAAGILNFFGALFLMVGLMVPIVASFFAIEMILTAFLQRNTLKSPYFAIKTHGYELNVIYLLLFLVLIVNGAGVLSVDSLIGF